MAHICGFYYLIPDNIYGGHRRNYLPQVELQAHTTILSVASRTQLTQTFVNPSSDKALKQVRYTFPLYDGVSVVGFTCHIGDRVIQGEVKEREQAVQVFSEAVGRGETAGLLEQLPDASDVFTTTVGNVPPGAKIVVEITYVGELKHDAEVDGIRFTIPTFIAPRYGQYPGTLITGNQATVARGGNITITVDATLESDSVIRQVRSPSHPIAVSMGTTSSSDENPSLNRASATLSLGTAELGTDFVLQIVTKDPLTPRALLEEHPFIPGQRALMATLVPKFALPSARPEIVFVCDRSGSMGGGKIDALISALQVFLKSLPVGVKFNICSFGSTFSFLWKRSQAYRQSTLDEAVRHVQAFDASLGGTEMLAPIKDTIERRYKDMSLEVILVTDGEIWEQQALFDHLNKEISGRKAPIRVFTLGIGNDVSHALVEGIARAGNGFSQLVGLSERFDSKVVRMLKGALSPNINDYTLEIKYAHEDAMDNDDFEMVEKVTESLKVKLDLSEDHSSPKATQSKKKPMSLFDISANPDTDSTPPGDDASDQARYRHLPAVPEPKLLQAPTSIPPLFPFVRTSVYLLMSPSSVQRTPQSVLLRGTSAHGPLELEIPVEIVQGKASIIHQLAAKKAIAELEQGRGWLQNTMDQSDGAKLKDKYDGRFDEMVEREAVRLGVRFQVGGKWCSFVAVEKKEDGNSRSTMQDAEKEWEYLDLMPTGTMKEREMDCSVPIKESRHMSAGRHSRRSQSTLRAQSTSLASTSSGLFSGSSTPGYSSNSAGWPQPQQTQFLSFYGAQSSNSARVLKNPVACSAPPRPYQQIARLNSAAMPCPSMAASQGVAGGLHSHRAEEAEEDDEDEFEEALFWTRDHEARGGSTASQQQGQAAPPPSQAAGIRTANYPQLRYAQQQQTFTPQQQQQQQLNQQRMMAGVAGHPSRHHELQSLHGVSTAQQQQRQASSMTLNQRKRQKEGVRSGWRLGSARGQAQPQARPQAQPQEQLSDDPLHALIALQSFEGNWDLTPALLTILSMRQVDSVLIRQHGEKVVATILAIVWLEKKMMDEHESWELVAVKAKTWLEGMGFSHVDQVWQAIEKLVA